MDVRTVSGKSQGPRVIRQQVCWLTAIGICGLLIFGAFAVTALHQIEVNGPLYKTIALNNELLADYSPPSQNLLQAALICVRLVDDPDSRARPGYEQHLKSFEQNYNAVHDRYMARTPQGDLTRKMQAEAYSTAQEYFRLADQLVALVNEGHQEAARTLLDSTMNPLYERHAMAIEQLVAQADKEARATEAQAAHSVHFFSVAMGAIGLLVFVIVSLFSWGIARGISAEADKLLLSEESRSESEERYRATFEQAAIGIIHVSFEGKILRCNPRFAQILGYPPEEILGRTFQQFTPPEYREQGAAALRQVVSGAAITADLEKPYLRKDGTLSWVKVTSSIQRDGNGKPLHLVAFTEDINDRKAAEVRLVSAVDALQASESRYRTIFQTSRDALSISRLSDGVYIEVNHAFLDLIGFGREELIGYAASALGIWADLKDRENIVEKLRQNALFRDERTRLRRKNGEVFWGLLSASVMNIDGVPCIFGVTRDISDTKAAEDEIRNLAFYDQLTGLPNRRLLQDRLLQALAGDLRNGRKSALLFVDLDDFKTLNDTLGHPIGDLLLQQAAQRLTACVREADTVARFGGDEFVLVLEGLGAAAEDAADRAELVGEKVLSALSQPYLLEGHPYRSTGSIGITVFGERRESANEMLQQTNIAMGQAKTAGGNTIRFFSHGLQAAVNARAAMKEDLSQAIREKQFLLYYQPQVDSAGLIGAEALLRWQHPVRGIVAPNEFIPLAEETGMILPLGNWALETACKQIASWAGGRVSAHLQIAVNISARQFSQPDFVAQVLSTLARTGADPKSLKLELTESMLANDIEGVIAKMTLLKSHGLSFSLDDFGTGYSSLSYLKRLPLDQLKIDRTFVHDILENVASAAIAQTIVSLGRAMDLSVIAEGVETEAQREFLAGLGTHSFQGYLFSRPLPLEEFERWMSSAEHAPLAAR